MTTRLSRLLARCALVGLAASACAGTALAGLGGWGSGGAGHRWVVYTIQRAGTSMTTGIVSVGDVRLGLRAIEVDGLLFSTADGRSLLTVEHLSADLRPGRALSRELSLPRVRARGVVVSVTADADGVTDWTRALGGPGTSDQPFRLPFALDLPDVRVDGLTATYSTPDGVAFALANGSGRARIDGRESRVEIGGLALQGALTEPAAVDATLGGTVVYDPQGLTVSELAVGVPGARLTANGTFGDRVSLGVRVDHLEGAALAPWGAPVGLGGTWVGSAALHGTAQRFDLDASLGGVAGSEGAVALDGSVDRNGVVPSWTAKVELGDLHVEHAYPALHEPVIVRGLVDAHGRGTDLAHVDASGVWEGGPQVLYGEAVDSVSARFSVRDGVLHLEDSRLVGIVGDLVVSGDVPLIQGPLALRVRGPLSPSRLAARGIPGLDGAGRVDVTVAADPRAEVVVAELDGTVTYAPFRYPNVELTQLVAPFHATARDGRVTGRANVRGEGLAALGLTAVHLRADGVGFEVGGARARASGPLRLEVVDYAPYAGTAAVDGTFAYEGRGEHVVTTASLGLGDWTVLGRLGTGGTVSVEQQDERVRTGVLLVDQGRSVLETRGTFDLASRRLVLDAMTLAPTPRATWSSLRPLAMTLTDGGVADADIALAGNLGRVEVVGRVGSEGPLDGVVRLSGFELDHVAELYPDDYDGLAGRLDLDLTLQGDAMDPIVDGSVAVDDLFWPGALRWLDLAGPVHVRDHALSGEWTLGSAADRLGFVRAVIPLRGGLAEPALDPDAPVDVRAELTPGTLARVAHLAPALDGEPVPDGRFSAVVEARASLGDPELRLAGVAELEGAGPAGRVELDLTRRASELGLAVDLREGVATRAVVRGHAQNRLSEVFAWLLSGGAEPDWADYDLYADQLEVDADLAGVPVAGLAALAGVGADLGGDLVGGVQIGGSAARPVVAGQVDWREPRIGEQALSLASASIVPSSDGYAVSVDARFGRPKKAPEDSLTVSGTLPVVVDLERDPEEWAIGELALDVGGTGVPLAVLSAFDPAVHDAAGRLVVEGHVGGTLVDPEPQLVARLERGRIGYETLGVVAEDVALEIALDGRRVELHRAQFALLPGQGRDLVSEARELVDAALPRVSVHGAADLDEDWMPRQITGRVRFEDGPWLLALDDRVLRVDGSVAVRGEWPALAIGGDLAVVYGRMALDAAELAGAHPLTLDPSLVVVRGGAAPPLSSALAAPPLYQDFDLDLHLDLHRNVELAMGIPFVEDFGKLGAELSRADIAARLGGDLQISLVGGEPSLVGQLDVVEGSARVLRSSLRLDEGTITFAGGDPYEDAHLDLHGSMAVSGGELDVAIGGTPPAPVFRPSSEEFPDETEQFAILLTGQAPDELTADQGDAATRLLAQTVLASLLSGRTLGTLSIEPDNSVRLGVPLSPTLYAATLVRPMVSDPAANALSVQLEWSLARRLVLSGGLGDRMGWGDLFWEVRF